MKQNQFTHVSIYDGSHEGKAKRLRILLDMAPYTLEAFCKKYHFSPTTMKYWTRAKGGGLTPKGAKRIVSVMREEGVESNENWLLAGRGSFPQYLDVRKGSEADLSKILQQQEFYEKTINEEMNHFCHAFDSAIVLQIIDDGMEPQYEVDDHVGGIRLYGKHIERFLNCNCIVETEDEKILCRRLTIGNEINSYNLVCTNGKTVVNTPIEYNIKLKSAALVSHYWKKYPFGKS